MTYYCHDCGASFHSTEQVKRWGERCPCGSDLELEEPVRRMRLVSASDLEEIERLARAAIRLHDMTTHHGPCEVCDLVEVWRPRMRVPNSLVAARMERLRARAAARRGAP